MCFNNVSAPQGLQIPDVVTFANNIFHGAMQGVEALGTPLEQIGTKVSGQDAANDAYFNTQQVNAATAAQNAQIAATRKTLQENDVNASNTAASTRKAAGNQSLGTLGFSAIQAQPAPNPGKDFLGL